MSEVRRGYAVLLQAGDAEISGALAEGIVAARLPEAKPLEPDEIRTVAAEMDRQAIARLMRVAMHKQPVDYGAKITKALGDYGQESELPGPLRRLTARLWGLYGLLVYALAAAFRAQERVLGG